MRSNTARITLIVFLLVAVVTAGAVFAGKYFRVERAIVLGCEERNEDEVIALANIEQGESYFKLNLRKIRENIDKNPYFDVVSVGFQLPNSLRISVKERRQAGILEYVGKYYFMDEEGMILEEISALPDKRVPLITGYRVSGVPTVGQMLDEGQPEEGVSGQIDALRVILRALHSKEATALVQKVNVEQVADLWMTSRAGFEISLGNFEKMEQKIRWFKAVEPILVSEGHQVGKINVSTGESASFMADDTQGLQNSNDLPADQPQDEADRIAGALDGM